MRCRLARTVFILPFIVITYSQTSAQTGGNEPAPPPVKTAQSGDRTSADETFDLNIQERRITERGFAASTSVEAGEDTTGGLLLRVGVALSAGEIDVLLRNVRGRVRFRASLDRILGRLNVRRGAGAVP